MHLSIPSGFLLVTVGTVNHLSRLFVVVLIYQKISFNFRRFQDFYLRAVFFAQLRAAIWFATPLFILSLLLLLLLLLLLSLSLSVVVTVTVTVAVTVIITVLLLQLLLL